MTTMRGTVLALAALLALAPAACKKDEATGAKKQPDGKGATKQEPVKPKEDPKDPKPPEVQKPTSADYMMKLGECQGYVAARDEAALAGCYTDTATGEFVDAMPAFTGGKAIVEGIYKPMFVGFPDFAVEPQLTLVSGNKVALLVIAQGTQTGAFFGAPPTGKKVGLVGIRYAELDESLKMTRDLHFANVATILGQLGLAKGPGRPVMDKGWDDKPTVTSEGSDAEKANVAVVKAYLEHANKHDVPGAVGTFAADAVFHDYFLPEDVKGAEGLTAFFAGMVSGFPDLKITDSDMFAAGDYVFAVIELTGTNDGPMPALGLKKGTKKAVKLRAGEFYRVKDGKIAEVWGTGNGLAMAQQLGLAPPPKK